MTIGFGLAAILCLTAAVVGLRLYWHMSCQPNEGWHVEGMAVMAAGFALLGSAILFDIAGYEVEALTYLLGDILMPIGFLAIAGGWYWRNGSG